MLVFLDSSPLGMVTNPNASPENYECSEWLEELLTKGVSCRVPEIADYEIRRELVRANKARGIHKLDGLKSLIGYVPITTAMMLKAAVLWANIRNAGLPTADDKALDGDVILAAQALLESSEREEEIIIATENVGHLARFDTDMVKSRQWRDI
jgi:hypothetical protein